APAYCPACPALEGLGVARAIRVPSRVDGLRDALAAERRSGTRERVSVPAIREAYGIDAVTRRIDDLYERLAASRSRVWRGRRPGRAVGAPQPACEGEQSRGTS